MFQWSDEAKAAIASRDYTVRAKIDVFNAGEYITTLPVKSGSVTEDETKQIRRTLKAKVLLPDDGSITPSNAHDLLHPLSGNELYAYRGVDIPGDTEWCPMGIFRIAKPQIGRPQIGTTLDLQGNDRSVVISQSKWLGPYTPKPQGAQVGYAIQQGIQDRWGARLPAPTFNVTPTGATLNPGTVLGLIYVASTGVKAAGSGNTSKSDPFADFMGWATSAGCEVFPDRQGVWVVRPVPSPGSAPPVAKFDTTDPSNTAKSLQRVLDATNFVNGITYVGTGVMIPTTVEDTSPTTVTVNTPGNGQWEVPANVTSINFAIAGGQGDGTGGGAGDEIAGTLSVFPGDIITFLVGEEAPAGSGQAGFNTNMWYANQIWLASGGGEGGVDIAPSGTVTAGANSGPGYVSFTYTGYHTAYIPGPPVVVTVWDDNPASPGYYLDPSIGMVPADPVIDQHCSSTDQATAAAKALLTLKESAADGMQFTCVCDPTLDAGDAVAIVDDDLKVTAIYILSAITTPFEKGTDQQVTCRSASVMVG